MTIVPFLNRVNEIILNPLIVLMFALALIYFIYGIIKFLSLEAGDKARDEARRAIMWGVVGMVVMFSVYGLIWFVLDTFGISANDISPDSRPYIGL